MWCWLNVRRLYHQQRIFIFCYGFSCKCAEFIFCCAMDFPAKAMLLALWLKNGVENFVNKSMTRFQSMIIPTENTSIINNMSLALFNITLKIMSSKWMNREKTAVAHDLVKTRGANRSERMNRMEAEDGARVEKMWNNVKNFFIKNATVRSWRRQHIAFDMRSQHTHTHSSSQDAKNDSGHDKNFS